MTQANKSFLDMHFEEYRAQMLLGLACGTHATPEKSCPLCVEKIFARLDPEIRAKWDQEWRDWRNAR